jgi:general stress protein YciG
MMVDKSPGRKLRGFASMDAAKRREIASMGGKAVQATGRAHRFSSQEAREAGRKGGTTAAAKGTAHRFSSEEARVAGQKGGKKRKTQNQG